MDNEDYLKNKQVVWEFAVSLSIMPEVLQAEFLKIFINKLPDEMKERHFDRFANFVYPEFRWKKTERWMEKRFISDMSRTPREVASMFLMYSKINTKMAPKIITLAQKTKDRLRKRIELGINLKKKKSKPTMIQEDSE
ncbi:MAG: hypothetical protein HY755_03445 [Nitrospirae bacterium]|nr:hypothetical protein [Nitrospirota bacterium]